MPKFNVERSTVINARAERVFAEVRDFRRWPKWSPWLVIEPDCALDFAADGDSYSWDGKLIGSGSMAVVGEKSPTEIRYRLKFFKPWKSEADVRLSFVGKGDSTEVVWAMNGALPFFMFWMKPMMTALIGMDYERGLGMLKDLVETGSVPSSLEVLPDEFYPGCRYVGVRTKCPIAELGTRMEADFAKLHAWFEKSGMEPDSVPFSGYEKWDFTKGVATYVAGFPVADPPSSLPDGFVVGELPACKVYSIRHTGAYRHLGNAWNAGIYRARNKVFKQRKGLFPFETYETAIGKGPESELVATVRFPRAE